MKPVAFYKPVPFIHRLVLLLRRRFSAAPSFFYSEGKVYVKNNAAGAIGARVARLPNDQIPTLTTSSYSKHEKNIFREAERLPILSH
jgi:hypothetical protein